MEIFWHEMEQTINTYHFWLHTFMFESIINPFDASSHFRKEIVWRVNWYVMIEQDFSSLMLMYVKIIWVAAAVYILIAWLFKRFNSYRVRNWKCFPLWNFFQHTSKHHLIIWKGVFSIIIIKISFLNLSFSCFSFFSGRCALPFSMVFVW